MRIELYDAVTRIWRGFEVVPNDPEFVPRCGNGLHQFYPTALQCACGAIKK
jgi:hypothetical protein